MERLVYRLFLALEWLLRRLSPSAVFLIGGILGSGARWVLPGYRKLVRENLRRAFPDAKNDCATIERDHFRLLGANLLSAIRSPYLSREELLSRIDIEGMHEVTDRIAKGRGVVLAIAHTGNWELYAQLTFLLPGVKTGTIYQALRNRPLDAHLNRLRQKHGMATFNRAEGFHQAIDFLRAGGVVGVLVDQHAGDSGLWTPFFERLASTSPLAATLATRSNACIVHVMGTTASSAPRWKFKVTGVIESVEDIDAATAAINTRLEEDIRSAPADWFWVHSRWKTPRPNFLLSRYRRGVFIPKDAKVQPFRVLLRSPNWLGDAVMALPAVERIAAGRPDLHLTVAAPAALAPLWRRVAGVHAVIELKDRRKLFDCAREIRAAGPFDTAVLFPNSLRAVLEARLAGIAYCAGFGNRISRLLIRTIPPSKPGWQPLEHHARRYLRLAHWVGADTFDQAHKIPRIAVAPLEISQGASMAIGLCAGAEYGPAKRWLPERYIEVAKLIAGRRRMEWQIFGVEKDRAITDPIVAALGESVRDWVGKTSLDELIDRLAACRLLVTNDTGTMHLATAVGVPVVAIFGSTEPALTGPPEGSGVVIRRHVSCSPCFLRECPIDFRCMKAVGVDRVVEAALRLLDRGGGQ